MPPKYDETLQVVRAALSDEGPPPFKRGELVGAYVVDEVIGRGGQGLVYAALDSRTGTSVALKVLRHDLAAFPEMIIRFLREATLLSQLRHPNIVAIHEFGTLPDGRMFLAMERLFGPSLADLLRARGRMDFDRLLPLVLPVCSAVAEAHARGIIHRDLKAGNVMLSDEGETARIKLVDFGIAKSLAPAASGGQQPLTTWGQRLGTTYAMAPEQVLGRIVDVRADIYALGVLFFELLTGRPPFESQSNDELERLQLHATPPRVGTLAPVPVEAEEIVARCLEKDPAKRFQSVTELMSALEAVSSEQRASVTRRGIAVHVEVTTDSAIEFLDSATAELELAGFALSLATSTASLLVRVLPDDGADAEAQIADAIERCRRLRADAEVSFGTGVRIRAQIANGEFSSSGTRQLVGGELARPQDWRAERTLPGSL